MKKLLFILLFLGVMFVVVGLFLPSQIHVERSIAINRPAATLFTLLNSYRHFQAWSPWAGLDPEAVFTRSGPESGVGARLSWIGDPALIGTGWQEIIESVPNERVAVDLDFGAQGVATAYFDIRGDSLGSLVTWGFDTDVTEDAGFVAGLMGRYFGLFFDRWIGKDYEQGLAAFKAFAESLPAQDFSRLEVELVNVEPVGILVVSASSGILPGEIANALASAYGEIMAAANATGSEVTGQPMAITRELTESSYEFDAAIPVNAMDFEPAGRVRYDLSPSGPAVRVVHQGAYEEASDTYAQLAAWMAAHGLVAGELVLGTLCF